MSKKQMLAKTHTYEQTKRLLHSFSSLRFRLVLWYLLILGIVLCSFSAAIYFSEEHTLYQNQDTLLNTTIEQLATSYDPQQGHLAAKNFTALVIAQNPQGHITQVDPMLPPDTLAALHLSLSQVKPQGNNQLSFTSHASNGQILHFTTTGEPVLLQMGLGWSPYAMKRVTITNQQNQLLSILYIGIPSDIPNQLGQLLTTLIITMPLILLFSSGGGYWLASKAMRPIQTITRTAQEIGETNLHRRLNLKRRYEIGGLAMTFDHMLDRLESAFARQQQFTADASHELRTPLSIVTTEVERVLQRPHTAHEYAQALEITHMEVQRMTQLVNGLLMLARADKGQTILKRERVDLSEIIVDGVECLSTLAEQNGIEVRLSGLDELVIWGDQLYLSQLCTNLLENAIKYSAGIGKGVEVKLDCTSDQARIQIIDEGPGIEALQYLEMMTNMPIGHPFRRPAVWGELPLPLLLAPIAKGRSYFCARC